VITAYSIFFGGFLLLGGRVADLRGRRLVFMSGVALFTASSLLCGLAWSEASLIVFRAAQGLGGAILSPAALSILTTAFAEGRERNLALGIWGAIAGSGAAAGTLLGGVLTSALGWEWIFFVNVPVGALVVGVTPLLVRESHAALDQRGFDLAGAVSITAGLMLLVYAMTRATQEGWGDAGTIGLLLGAAALIGAFLLIELRSRAPVLPLRIFRLRALRGANVVGFLIGAVVFSQFYMLSLYMQQVLGYSAMQTGAAYIATTMTSIAMSGVAQAVTTRFGPRLPLAFGLTVFAGAQLAYTQLPVRGHYFWDLFPYFVLSGIGLAFGFVPVAIAALTGVRPADAGIASGLINTSQQIGGAIGLALATTVATSFTDGFAPAAITHGFRIAFWVLLGIAVAGAVLALVLLDSRRPQLEDEPATATV
jgi:EmrB/QacA subfamily drug resistance transporter